MNYRLKYFFIFLSLSILIVLLSCNNTDVIVSGTNVSDKNKNDSITITINSDFIKKEKMSFFLVDRKYQYHKSNSEFSEIEIQVPSLNYIQKLKTPNSDYFYIQFKFYYEDSIIKKYVTFDSSYYYRPDHIKFAATVNTN